MPKSVYKINLYPFILYYDETKQLCTLKLVKKFSVLRMVDCYKYTCESIESWWKCTKTDPGDEESEVATNVRKKCYLNRCV